MTREVIDELICLSSAKDSRDELSVCPCFPCGRTKFRFTVEDVVRRVEDMARLNA